MSNRFKDVLRKHTVSSAHSSSAQETSDLPPPVLVEPSPEAPPPFTAEDIAAQEMLAQENEQTAKECIAASLVTPRQCEQVEVRVQKLMERHEHPRFEEVAVQMGFCTRGQVAELQEELRSRALLKDRYIPSPKIYNRQPAEGGGNNLMGTRMVAAGLITPSQRDKIVERQHKLALQGAQIRFGELAVQLGFCSEAEVDALLEDVRRRENNQSW